MDKEGEHKVRALQSVPYPDPVGANLVFALPICVRPSYFCVCEGKQSYVHQNLVMVLI